MPLYPLPAIVALVGWSYVFVSSKWGIMGYAVGSLLLGLIVFGIWDALIARTPAVGDPTTGEPLASPPESE
jgi:hypothetical protein